MRVIGALFVAVLFIALAAMASYRVHVGQAATLFAAGLLIPNIWAATGIRGQSPSSPAWSSHPGGSALASARRAVG
jgi:hypothetical protein